VQRILWAGTVVLAAAGLALLQPGGAVVAVATSAFLLLTPAVTAALLLPGLDLLSRVAVGVGAAIVVDTAVAQTMLSTGLWSIRGGIVAVGLLAGALLLLVPHTSRTVSAAAADEVPARPGPGAA
jgi:hypothetical protein